MSSKTDAKAGHEIKFKFEQGPGYQLHPASGAWGGVNPQGDIHVDFYYDFTRLPDRSVLEISPDGDTLKEVREPLSQSVRADGTTEHLFTRTVVCGLVLNVETARAVAKFLLEKIDEREKAKAVVAEIRKKT